MYYTGMVTEETHQTCSDEECSSLRSHKLHGGDSSTRAPGVAAWGAVFSSLSISLFQLAILSSRPLAHCCLKFRHLPRQTLHILHRRRGPIARPLLPPTTSLDQDPATPSIACISIGKVVGDSNVPEQTFLGLSNNAFYPVDPCLNGNKLVHSELKQYVSKNDFSAAATTEKGCVAVASNKDDPRLFDHLGINAKTALPALPALRTVPGADNLEHTHDDFHSLLEKGRQILSTTARGNPSTLETFEPIDEQQRVEAETDFKASQLNIPITVQFDRIVKRKSSGRADRKLVRGVKKCSVANYMDTSIAVPPTYKDLQQDLT
ncbi:unnamed protein product [Zymoseptoria tritici ST99CH_1A5]|uniref:Vacuolar import/degradation Vid27 C-terminal domain-containing protein n=1 Tax=Zymoseptoria tritici ST99CH_1A5 TaxID=1276529 RepID=A0A1Y6M315_ZYMTR|nr:unnamed protein product [Zymoseptoria tritici ST99CH_1A5]